MQQTPAYNLQLNSEEATRSLYRSWRERFVTPLLVGSLIFGLVALVPAAGAANNKMISIIFIVTYVITGVVAFIPFPYIVRIGAFLLMVLVLGIIELIRYGILGDGIFFLLGLAIFATMMISPRAGMLAILVDLLTCVLLGYLFLSGRIVATVNTQVVAATILDWISGGAVIVMFGFIIVTGFERLEAEVLGVRKQVDATLYQLTDERNNLEKTVAARTLQLKKVNEIGRSVTAILDPDELLAGATVQIANEFESYHTAIYFVDPTGQWAELKDATGDAGRVMRESNHRVDLNGKTTIASAIRTKQIRVALDTGKDAVLFDSPLLPYTRSQIVMPLIVAENAIGAIEMQSTKEAAFSTQDVDTYYNMANQVATAVENSRLFQQAQQSLSEMRATQRQYLQSAWSSLTADAPLEYELGDDDSGDKQIEIPLTLRDQIIGQVQMTTDENWTPEQRNLIEAITTQAALALENARLVEESQSTAAREKLANEIIAKIWSSTTIDSIMQTTVRELGRALAATEIDIEIKMGEVHE